MATEQRIVSARAFPCDRCGNDITDGVLVALGGVWCDGCATEHAEPKEGVEDRAETLCNEIVGWLGDERIYAACMGYTARAQILEEVIRKIEEIYLEMPYDEGN